MKLKGLYLILIMTICTALMAQEKYEQAIVKRFGVGVIISLEGKETVYEKSSVKAGPAGVDLSFLLGKLAELRNDGWEVWNTTSGDTSFEITYFLRRKLK